MTDTAEAQQVMARTWWVWLIAGIFWIIVASIILQFNGASVRSVGVIVGAMLFVAGMQYLLIGTLTEGSRWPWYIFGVILGISGIFAMANPVSTFVTLADMLGFLFALAGIVWIVEALGTRSSNDLWWFSLIAGILMVLIGFDTSSQWLISQAYTLLVFAAIWALFKGVTDIVLAFTVRKLGVPAIEM